MWVCASADLDKFEEEYPAWVVFSHLLITIPCQCTVYLSVYCISGSVLYIWQCTVYLAVYCISVSVLYICQCTVYLPQSLPQSSTVTGYTGGCILIPVVTFHSHWLHRGLHSNNSGNLPQSLVTQGHAL